MLAYLGDIWKCRYFWLSLVHNDLRARYRGSVLGIGWSLLQPLGMTVILCVVFTRIFHQEVRYFAPFLLAGLALWNFIAACAIQGSVSFLQGELYIRQFSVPMAIYPLRVVLGAAIHALLSLAVAVLVVCSFLQIPGLLPMLALLLGLGLLGLFGWFLTILFGLANVLFRDTRHLAEVALQGLFYLTPIIYPLEQAAQRSRLLWVLQLNPLVPLFDLVRVPLLANEVPALATWVGALVVVLGTGLLAVAWLARLERRIIFHL
jgi:lipopolysaccharide transport system permease protein